MKQCQHEQNTNIFESTHNEIGLKIDEFVDSRFLMTFSLNELIDKNPLALILHFIELLTLQWHAVWSKIFVLFILVRIVRG